MPREGWLKHILPTTDVWLLFPAKLYCGQSLLDGRRESVIIDYAYNDDLPGYQAHPDALAGRNGLRIRDEIRMIRPGFYLGRAYANKIFLLNFMLFNDEVAEAGRRLRRRRRRWPRTAGPASSCGRPRADDAARRLALGGLLAAPALAGRCCGLARPGRTCRLPAAPLLAELSPMGCPPLRGGA